MYMLQRGPLRGTEFLSKNSRGAAIQRGYHTMNTDTIAPPKLVLRLGPLCYMTVFAIEIDVPLFPSVTGKRHDFTCVRYVV